MLNGGLGDRDSDPDILLQKQKYYHYTIPQLYPVHTRGLEPLHPIGALAPKANASTNSATCA